MRDGLVRSSLLVAVMALIATVALAGQDAAVAPPAGPGCNAPEYRRLDFKLGEFEVTGMEGARAGDSRVESILGGCMLVEHWHGAISGYGQSIFYYDRKDQRWHSTFINDDGDVLVMDGVFAGDTLVFRGAAAIADFNGLHRMSWSPLPGGGVKQYWEFSADNGATWKTIHIGYYARRH